MRNMIRRWLGIEKIVGHKWINLITAFVEETNERLTALEAANKPATQTRKSGPLADEHKKKISAGLKRFYKTGKRSTPARNRGGK